MPEKVLIVHGLGGSGEGHWQRWLAERLRARGLLAGFPGLPSRDAPSLGEWCESLDAELRRAAEPPVVVCHSLGAVLWLQVAARRREPLASRVLLVAPPSVASGVEEIAEFVPPPLDRDAVALAAPHTRMVCGTGDVYCPEGAHELYAPALGVPVDVIPGGEHLNTDAGYGPWPAVEEWCLDGGAVPLRGREA